MLFSVKILWNLSGSFWILTCGFELSALTSLFRFTVPKIDKKPNNNANPANRKYVLNDLHITVLNLYFVDNVRIDNQSVNR